MRWRDYLRMLPMPLRILLGAMIVATGMVGVFLPFVQGLLLIFIGLWVLSHDIPAVRRWRRQGSVWWARRRERKRILLDPPRR